ncbi:tigger transposable element-derived protein 6-like [Uloborus diversus]|uniref:tigger transposable element-derived protein 6-like n=1 Tax=Uloborus diversus TaxID=327109 RepID=UPI002409706B|nr:tigger transposable element-derived protein 6-like [Uloborus diversus]
MASKRKRLTLKEKIEVINVAENEKLSLRDLGEKFKISKNQVSNVLKEKEEIKRLWITNSNENSKTVKFRKTEGEDIDQIVFKWFSAIGGKNIPVSGVLLQEKAKEVADSLGLQNFKASNGWLEKFKLRHNVTFKTVCGKKNLVLPNKTLCFKGEKCSGGKSSKERLTVLLCCNSEGEFEVPLVIGKAKKPRCFKNINPKTLSVQWYFNRKAWMTQNIMIE